MLIFIIRNEEAGGENMALKLYEEGLKLFAKKDYKKAIDKFTKAIGSTDNLQLIAKCKSYINLCNEKLDEKKSNKEKYDYGYAVFLINNGQFEESKKVLDEIFRTNKNRNETYLYLYAIAEAGENNEINAEKYLKKAMANNPSIIHIAVKDQILKPIALKILGK